MRELTYNEAALEAVAEEMRRDAKIFYMSTDALPPLLREFGAERVRATPITEAAFTGMAIGAAGCGFRPIADWRQVKSGRWSSMVPDSTGGGTKPGTKRGTGCARQGE